MSSGELAKMGVLGLLGTILFFIFFPYACQKRSGPNPTSYDRSKLKQSGLALIMYSSDNDGMTVSDNWQDLAKRYVTNEEVLGCHMFVGKSTAYGHALNIGYVSKLEVTLEPTASFPMLFDSLNKRRNAVDSIKSLAMRWDARAFIAFADGHVAMIGQSR